VIPRLLWAYDPSSGLLDGGVYRFNDQSAFMCQDKYGMLMDSIRFKAYDLNLGKGGMTQFLSTRMLLGRHELTPNYIPVASLHDGGGYSACGDGYSSFNEWRFSRPMYVPPSRIVLPALRYEAVGLATAGNIGAMAVSQVCRILERGEPIPKTSYIPYATHFNSPQVVQGAAAVDVESGTGDLTNPFSVPVHITRITLRAVGYLSGSPGLARSGLISTSLMLRRESGEPIIRDLIPMYAAGGGAFFSIPVKFTMKPRETLFCRMHIDLSTWPGQAGTSYLSTVAAVGYREVPVEAI
jgi:hypothetical protein